MIVWLSDKLYVLEHVQSLISSNFSSAWNLQMEILRAYNTVWFWINGNQLMILIKYSYNYVFMQLASTDKTLSDPSTILIIEQL